MMWTIIAVFAVGLLAALIIPKFSEYRAKSRCLNAGGTYDQQANKCILPTEPKRSGE